MNEEEKHLPSKGALESWLSNPVTKTLMDDMRDRIEDSRRISTSTLLTSPKKIAEANKQIGIIENAEYILVFPSLLLNDIITEQEKKEEQRDGRK